MSEKKNFYITTTLPYVNAPLHIGHALEFVRADVLARSKKIAGYDVFFNTGTDEHGIKILNKAKEMGKDPQVFVDESLSIFKEQLGMFGLMSEEEGLHFIRTTDKTHESLAQEFWQLVFNNGYIYKDKYEAKYCVGCESDKTESELNEQGFCPYHDGVSLESINEENYFFKYSAFGDRLLDFYSKNPNFITPDFRFNEMKEFVKRGLQDISISRLKTKMPWGIEVPGDSDHVMYVWFDALTNYINTLKDWNGDQEMFGKFWIEGTPTQYCGKDNTRWQGALWQAMLMAAGFPNSHQIIVNGHITGAGGVKMSKTLGNVVDPRDIVNEYGTEALRFFLLKEISSVEDSPFTHERFKNSYNAHLANGLGNLVNRILKMVTSYGVVLDFPDRTETLEEIKVEDGFKEYRDSMESYNYNSSLDFIWKEIGEMDEFIAKEQPFKKIKVNEEEAKEDLAKLLLNLWYVAILLEPFLPETAEKIQQHLVELKMPEEPLFLRKD
ncbi:MAG: methionyl-tRNA synthetase [Candidatus Paceibacteria bacterium]|jgi:methionyl-tRNA synthetase